VRKLHDQSKEKLEAYYEDDQIITCSYFQDLTDKKIDENQVLFINWESINKKDKNTIVRENEQDFYLEAIIENTKNEGRTVILIIDESHHTASTDKSKELIETIGPKVTIEVSATPHLTQSVAEIEEVYLNDVKAEEMIKSEIAVNPEFLNIKVGTKSSDELVIEQALNKREELQQLYKNENTNINPLILVQLPDKKSDLTNKKDEVTRILNDKFKINEKNGKLAVWLSEEKTDNLANINKNDNEVEVLLFKQAIALGWDCPRASILVIFRETKSFIFTIQTIGRIMRIPELKYYNNDELNKGFVFTNLENIEIAEDYAKDYVTVFESKRDNKLYDSVTIPSLFLKRQRERTRLSGEFPKIFADIADQRKLKTKLMTKPSKIANPIIADGVIKDIDKAGEIEHKGQIEIELNDVELQARFDRFIRDNCSPYAPTDSSDRMKTALYQYFNKNYNIDKYDPEAQKIVLGKENVKLIVDTINLSKEKYYKDVVKSIQEKRELQKTEKWEVPVIISYNTKYKAEQRKKSVMKPLYSRSPSKPEQTFMDLLDNSDKVKWWYKNGETEIKYFAVHYQDNGIDKSFYVDFIIRFTDGTIGLFDTKSGRTAEEAGPRAKGLQKYIKEQNKKNRKLFGGIVINVQGTWRYHNKAKYDYNPEDLSNWKVLEI